MEEAIAQHRGNIDDTMLELLEQRMAAAEQVERQPEVLQGLQLLYRRLKSEVERQQASPALQLLDELMGILDPQVEGGGFAPSLAMSERRRAAAARVRAAFSGGLPTGTADVLSLAAQLSAPAGSQLADELVADPVDPMVFMAEVTELLSRVQRQLGQLEAYIAAQQAAQERRRRQPQHPPVVAASPGGQGEEQEERGGLAGMIMDHDQGQEEEEAQQAALLEAEGLLEQRAAAAALVQEVLDVAQAVMRQMQLYY